MDYWDSCTLKQPDKAAAAAHTYFQANPEHVEMGENLEQYKDLEGVNEDHFVDREARPHQYSFTAAVALYVKGDYEGAIVLFEEALTEYYEADVECRALCQGPQRFEGHDHLRYRYSLHELISDHTITGRPLQRTNDVGHLFDACGFTSWQDFAWPTCQHPTGAAGHPTNRTASACCRRSPEPQQPSNIVR
ncbi:prolyl 3-hydroxylase 2 [Lates japonicus]|uniref:Prolyl 3-hydroxylase 2 n=1 Tax=Lates japonicus TaxID=270547 RepID=A0AAD3M9P5_LATJO|nr:prolyl 3-hydroxylase 2 [Lates japonicus]